MNDQPNEKLFEIMDIDVKKNLNGPVPRHLYIIGNKKPTFIYLNIPQKETTLWIGRGSLSPILHLVIHDPENEKGCGGEVFYFNTLDGIVGVKGPWASNSTHYNETMWHLNLPDVMEVSFRTEAETSYYHGYCVPTNWARRVVEFKYPNLTVKLCREGINKDFYEIVKR